MAQSGRPWAVRFARGIGFGAAAACLTDALMSKDSKDCAFAAATTDADLSRLLMIKRTIEAAQNQYRLAPPTRLDRHREHSRDLRSLAAPPTSRPERARNAGVSKDATQGPWRARRAWP
jgi:hypothetical protein